MSAKYISAYKEQTHQFFKQLEIAKKTYGFEAVHEMRVAVKKIRSLLQIFEAIFSDSFNTEKSFKYFRKIFKSAAKIRDSHVMTGLVYQYKTKNSGYTDLYLYFANLENDGIKDFKTTVANTKKLAFKTSSDYTERLRNQEITAEINIKTDLHIKKKIRDLSKSVKNATNDKSIHKLRIKLKELNFIFDVQNDDEKKQTVSGLKNIASDLGRWHDKIILIHHIKNFKECVNNNKKLPDYIHLQNLLFSENKNETEKILSRLKKELELLCHNFY